jgi:hypothetical protein
MSRLGNVRALRPPDTVVQDATVGSLHLGSISRGRVKWPDRPLLVTELVKTAEYRRRVRPNVNHRRRAVRDIFKESVSIRRSVVRQLYIRSRQGNGILERFRVGLRERHLRWGKRAAKVIGGVESYSDKGFYFVCHGPTCFWLKGLSCSQLSYWEWGVRWSWPYAFGASTKASWELSAATAAVIPGHPKERSQWGVGLCRCAVGAIAIIGWSLIRKTKADSKPETVSTDER